MKKIEVVSESVETQFEAVIENEDEGDRTAARRDGVAEHGDEERAAAQWALRAKIAQQGPNGGG